MSDLTPAERYAAEQEQSDHDHHVPTAGAMTGHVLSNLFVQASKARQAAFHTKSRHLAQVFADLAAAENAYFDQLAGLLRDVGEAIPTTTEEFTTYTMIAEDPTLKFAGDQAMAEALVADLDTQNLFIPRAIKLAANEEKYPLQNALIDLLGFNQRQICLLQGDLGRELTEGRYLEDDEDDD